MGFYDLINKNIFSILHLETLDKEKRFDLLDRISDYLEKKIIVRIIEFLEEDKVEYLVKLLEENNNEKIMNFLDENVPVLEEIIWQEINSFKEEAHKLVNV